MNHIKYYSLIRKSDNHEVYSSPDYTRKDCVEVIDINKISTTLKFYFDRINSGIDQQLNSPKLSDEQKAELKHISPDDYLISYTEIPELGCMFQKKFWTIEASKWISLDK